jgi:hypothetical protein
LQFCFAPQNRSFSQPAGIPKDALCLDAGLSSATKRKAVADLNIVSRCGQ